MLISRFLEIFGS